VAFRQINKKTGNRLRQQLIDEETRIAVEAHDKGRGYEHAKGSYLMIEDHELEAIEIESNHTIEIDTFVPRAEIDERFLDSPYYVAPNEPVGQEAFAVIREAMRGKDMVALGRVVLSKRERVIMLQPWDNGLLGMTLRYPYELREAKDYFYDIADVTVEPELHARAAYPENQGGSVRSDEVRRPLRAGGARNAEEKAGWSAGGDRRGVRAASRRTRPVRGVPQEPRVRAVRNSER
jgi:DNA end-binding protein Ku